MRVISQSGAVDVPYETGSFNMICAELVEPRRTNIYYYHSCFGTAIKLAEYSAKTKAVKAMEMLREQYKRLETLKLYTKESREDIKGILTLDELGCTILKTRKLSAFQFPQDDEIEV